MCPKNVKRKLIDKQNLVRLPEDVKNYFCMSLLQQPFFLYLDDTKSVVMYRKVIGEK